MRIAILGALWFVGRNIVRYFKNNNEIFAFVRRIGDYEEWVEYIFWDNSYEPNFCEKIDVCIDCVSDVDFTKNDTYLMGNNVWILKQTKKFLEDTSCEHYIYISSSSVYMGKDGILDEADWIDINNLRNSYARSKYFAEEYIRNNFKKWKITILRPRAIYGDDDTTLLPKLLSLHFFSYLIFPWNQNIFTSVTHIENLLHALDTVINKQTGPYGLYNVSDEKQVSYKDLYTKLVLKYGFSRSISLPGFIIFVLKYILPNKWRYIEDTFSRNKQLDISKIKTLWYNPKRDLDSFLS